MRIAVLGAGGGLGRNVVDAARAAGHEVVALVRDPTRDRPPTPLADAIATTLAWHRAHPTLRLQG